MEFGKRRHDTTDTTDFCPRQLVTDLLRTSSVLQQISMQQWASPFTVGVSWLSRPDQLTRLQTTSTWDGLQQTDRVFQSTSVGTWKERIFVDISSCYGEVANLLRTCCGETGVQDFDLKRVTVRGLTARLYIMWCDHAAVVCLVSWVTTKVITANTALPCWPLQRYVYYRWNTYIYNQNITIYYF